MNNQELPPVSIVVIGRNEGDRLRLCLEAIAVMDYPAELLELIYVDSSTTEESVELAQQWGVRVLRIREGLLSAARSRNLGLQHAQHELIHFFDADTIVHPQWLRHAVSVIQQPTIACVFGRREELRPQSSLYMRVCAFDWHVPAGPWRLCGGDSLFRRAVLEELGGFREDMIAGEEPELSYRLRQMGWTIWRLDEPMVRHDLNMTRFEQYWKRAVRSGWAYAVVSARCGCGLHRLWLAKNLANVAEVAGAMTLVIGLAWVGGWLGLLATIALLILRMLWIALRVRRRADGWITSLLYAGHCLFCRIPILVGQFKGMASLSLHLPPKLMEYNQPSPASSPSVKPLSEIVQ